MKDEINKKIEILEQELHLINIKLHQPEKKNWWGKNISILISIFALLTSISFSIYNNYKDTIKQTNASQASKIELIQNLITEIVENDQQYMKDAINPSLYQNFNPLSVNYNFLRIIKLKKILTLLDNENDTFPPDIYVQVSNNLINSGDYESALKFIRRSLSISKDIPSKIIAYRNLGYYYGIKKTKMYNSDSSGYYRKKSIDEADKFDDENNKLNFNCYSYYLWANQEILNDNSRLGFALLDSAEQICSKLPESNGLKVYDANLIRTLKRYSPKQISLINQFSNALGSWQIIMNGQKVGQLYFSSLMGSISCNVYFINNNQITETYAGQIISNDNGVCFNIQGLKTEKNSNISIYQPQPNQIKQTNGMLTLTNNLQPGTFKCSFYLFNETKYDFIITRSNSRN